MKKSVFAPVILLATAAPLPVFAAESLSMSVSLQTLIITGFFLAPVMLATFISRQQPAIPQPQMAAVAPASQESDFDVFGFESEEEALTTMTEEGVAQPGIEVNAFQGVERVPAMVVSRHKGLKAA